MKKLSTTIILLSIINFTFFGQTKEENIQSLFKLMKVKKACGAIFDNLLPVYKQQIGDSKEGNKVMELIIEETKELTNKIVDENMVSIYSKHFSDEEIKDLIAFYKTPTGKKLIEKQTIISKESMELTMKYMPEFQKKITEKIAEIKKQ